MPPTDVPEDDDLPRAAAVWVQLELAPGERLVWAGRAHPRQSLGRQMLGVYFAALVPAIVVLGFAVAQLKGLLGTRPDMDIFGFMGVLVGVVWLLFGGASAIYLLVVHRRTRRTCYALTDRRAIVWRPAPEAGGLEVRSFWPADFNTLFRVDYGDGSGDLIFHEITVVVGLKPQPVRQGFMGILNVRHVEALFRKTLLERPSAPASQEVFTP
jgi:hypothetical protein